ncbi:MAG: DUF1643 domain-containing protein [Cyanobacteria bacterium P01_F01_bin.150]
MANGSIQLPDFSEPSGAIFSECDRYRYVLWRRWAIAKPMVLFIALNPSTADATVNDPTMRRCISFAQSWGYGGIIGANLFAYRTPQPTVLKQASEPIGPEGDRWISSLCQYVVAQPKLAKRKTKGQAIILAWGNHGQWLGRDRSILQLIQAIVPMPHCLTVTKQGQPAHPLYLPKSLKPLPYSTWQSS